MKEEVYKEGAILYFENDPSGRIFIVRSGTVELSREAGDSSPRRIHPGELLGLSDSLGGKRRIGTARAVTNVSANVLDVAELEALLARNVEVALKVITSLCAELREIDEMIVRRMRGGMAGTMSRNAGLRMIADRFRRKNMIRAARYAYARFLETDPSGEERLEAALHLANLCEKDGEPEPALEIYKRLIQEFPEDPRPMGAYERLRGFLETLGASPS
ncbi:MAG: hypothetical protein D6679_14175 [Candidatus Hydrogenedentota bacterium]|nr:MAG: hypothetical protein D6679_14175 [Candidatus Hydrogenedentota bacterium]